MVAWILRTPNEVRMLRAPRLVPLAGILLASCASLPVPATRSPENPAHPAALEAVTPPATPGLMGDTQAREAVPEAPQPSSHEGHADRAAPASSPPDAAPYSCRMHPQVRSDKPGACPVCGMPLVATEKPKDDSR